MLIRQEEEQERRETLENDRLVREAEHQRILREGTTFHQHAQSHANDEAGGRFASVNAVSVVGAEPAVRYPAAGAHQCDPVGTEPPLGFSVNDLEPSMGTTRPTEDTGGAPSSAPPGDVAAPPPSSNGAEMAQREQKPDLASAMWPALSREARAQQAAQARAQAELRERSRRLADNLQATIDAVRREKGR